MRPKKRLQMTLAIDLSDYVSNRLAKHLKNRIWDNLGYVLSSPLWCIVADYVRGKIRNGD